MAGIFGYTGLAPAADSILKSLGYMRYAGCDSWGVLTIDESIHLRRALGDFEESKETIIKDDLVGTAGLAHTRWATHGEPDLVNAHPILDCKESIGVVHNGILDNYVELRRMLSEKGHTFRTQTDTEVIPHLVEELLTEDRTIEATMQHALKMMEGSFSFALVSTHTPDRIYAARKKHPIYFGRSNTSSIITSEPSCFPGMAYRVAPLARGSMAILDPKGITVTDIETGKYLKPNWVGVDRRFLAENRKGYRHYLEKEIAYEPEMLQIISLGDLLGIELLASSFDGADRVFLLPDSGSYNTALVASHLLGDIAKRQTRILPASEFLHANKGVFEDDLVVGICSGGVEQSLLEALRFSKAHGAHVAALTGNGANELRNLAQPLISLNREKMKLSRMGTFVGQAGLALMLAHTIRGNTDKGINELTRLGNSIKDSYRNIQRSVHELAPAIYESNSVFFFGRNTLYPIALEAAMDIQRLTNISSIGLERANLGRSTYVTINPGTTCIYFVPKDDKSSRHNAEEAISMGCKAVIGICESEIDTLDHQVVVPESRHLFPLSGMLPAQMLAYEISLLLGTNPDSRVYN